MDNFVRAPVAARLLDMTLAAFYGAVRAGAVPAYRLGPRRLRFRLDEIEAALKRQRTEVASQDDDSSTQRTEP